MATALTSPVLKAIHGRIGNLVFYYRNGKQCVRIHVIPRNPDTEFQRIVRRAFGNAVRSWQTMSGTERSAFNKKARYLNMSGYNLYISGYMKKNISAVYNGKISSSKSFNGLPAESSNSFPSVSEPYIKALRGNNTPTRQKVRPG